ncbi:MAG TPA: hypothetical protein VJG83_00565 [archaeon]|nr:hypothetical protein [archaeon]
MMHKYCPSCGSLDTKKLENGMEECSRCNFRGEMREGGMDQINALKRSIKASGSAPKTTLSSKPESEIKTNSQLKNKLNSLKGKKTDDFEII